MLNPDAQPYFYLHTFPRCYPSHPPPFSCYSFFHVQEPSIYRNYYWYRFPPPPSPALYTTNSTCTNKFEGGYGLKPKLEVSPELKRKTQVPVLPKKPYSCRFYIKKAPVRNSKVQPKETAPFDFDESETELGRTTVMIKNIPGRFTRQKLLELLDERCVEENERAQSSLSEYDFVYLPIDFRSKLNLGYAFVNFTTARAAKMLYKSMHKFKWDTYGSKKICEITYASIQGREALEWHFRDKNFKCESDEFLPIVLSPARNGSTSRPLPSVVGKLRAPVVKAKGHRAT